ncbi:alkylhydroperoxidase AhpD family core domain [Chlamydia trachomatis]|nr:alkylhydroperoxidase AhpD family core domain [Chlamydia trachomatis]
MGKIDNQMIVLYEIADNADVRQRENGGYIPNLIGVLANSPTALETYRTVGGINRRYSLSPTEREVVQITAAVTNGCGFCVAGHTAIAIKQIKMPEDVLTVLREMSYLTTEFIDGLTSMLML